ncbi:MAG TPA: hypothetical protein VJR06_08030 [Nitrososphaerales archaeon]|nr:hypothetical protein [Nitrososphaerales archaeon]
MSDSALVSVLLYGHIISAMAFLGGAIAFAGAVGPTLARLQPEARRDLISNLFPRFARLMLTFAALLAVFGVALVFAIASANPSQLSLTDPWGLRVAIGGTLGLVVVLDAFLVVGPAVKGMARIAQETPVGATAAPTPKFLALQRRVAAGSGFSILLMFAAVGFMVAAAGI